MQFTKIFYVMKIINKTDTSLWALITEPISVQIYK